MYTEIHIENITYILQFILERFKEYCKTLKFFFPTFDLFS